MTSHAEQQDPMSRAVDEASALVAGHFSLRPVDVRDGAGGAAKTARWVVWRILRDVSLWEISDICEQFEVTRMGVHYGLGQLDTKINGRRADRTLKARVEACLREAAGDST